MLRSKGKNLYQKIPKTLFWKRKENIQQPSLVMIIQTVWTTSLMMLSMKTVMKLVGTSDNFCMLVHTLALFGSNLGYIMCTYGLN